MGLGTYIQELVDIIREKYPSIFFLVETLTDDARKELVDVDTLFCNPHLTSHGG